MLAEERDFSGWRICGQFAFGHRAADLDVYLLVAPSLVAPATCTADAPVIPNGLERDLSKIASWHK